MLSAFLAAVMAAVSLTGTLPEAAPSMTQQCSGAARIEHALEGSPNWRDAGSPPGLAPKTPGEARGEGPLTYIHTPSSGRLIVEASASDEREGGDSRPGLAYWRETVERTRRACQRAETDCSVSTLESEPYGLRASTQLEREGEAMRRETLAFAGEAGCRYSVRFTGRVAAFDEDGWNAVRAALLELRDRVGGSAAASQ